MLTAIIDSMNMKKEIPSVLFLSLLTSACATGIAQAQETETTTAKQAKSITADESIPDVSVSDEGEPLVPEQFLSKPTMNRIDIGIGYVSDDAYKFGRYNGLQTDGAYSIADIKIREFNEEGMFWSLRGTNLGLESRYLRLEGGKQGSYKLFLTYDELPNYKDNTVQSPLDGIGSNNLTLPAGFDINTNLNSNLKNFELKTKREAIGVGAKFTAKQHWHFDIDFKNETKEGVDATGAAIANGSTQVVGFTTTSLIAEPIDYETSLVNAKVEYAGHDGQLGLTYHISYFDNNNDALNWQDPFNPAASASMSLAPDNEFHQLSLDGGYNLPYRSRITGVFSMGRMTQNDNFQPYTIDSTIGAPALPTNSLDGEVWLTTAQLKLSSRPLDKLRLNAELRYNERDNKTPINSYNYVVLDSHLSPRARTNNPYSYEKNLFKLDANYRFNAITSLRGGYKYEDISRSYVNAEREDTTEDTLYAKWKVKALSNVDLTILAETSQRDGSDYVPLTNENPALRKYFLADRDRDTYGAIIDFMATEKLFFSARADYNKDDYSNSALGLTEATQPVYTVDFSYTPVHNITTYGYYTYEDIQSSQAGQDISATGTDWTADFSDQFDTIGLGAKLTDLGRWDVGLDIVHSKSRGAIVMTDIQNPGTEVQYPDTTTELTSVKLWTTFNYSKQLSYKFGYWYEEYDGENWAIDGVAPYDPAAANILLLGNESLDYRNHVVTVAASYRFE
jgi:MtrB/PioB family decaheme-associated outer membrane protein